MLWCSINGSYLWWRSYKTDVREYGKTEVDLNKDAYYLGIEENQCWMSHTDYISKAPEGFNIIATTKDCPVAAMANVLKNYMEFNFIQK